MHPILPSRHKATHMAILLHPIMSDKTTHIVFLLHPILIISSSSIMVTTQTTRRADTIIGLAVSV